MASSLPPRASPPSQGLAPADINERVRLMRHGLVNCGGFAVSSLVGIVLVPILLQGLGAELYGVWVTALALSGLAGIIDFGLGWGLTRQVASRAGQPNDKDLNSFLSAAFLANGVMGVGGALLVVFLGIQLSRGLHLSSENASVARVVFTIVGLAVLGERLWFFSLAVLNGLRRFELSNLLTMAGAVIRATGIVVVLVLGGSLIGIAVWQAATAFLLGLGAYHLVRQHGYSVTFGLSRINWIGLRPQIRFSLQTQANALLSKIVWEAAPVVIGVLRGPSAIIPYYVGQRFPLAVSWLTWRTTEILFPAASEQQRLGSEKGQALLLEVGTRWPVVLATPLCLVLLILAPHLVFAWLGEVPQQAALVLRLIALAVWLEALGAGALYVLWGLGAAHRVVMITAGMALMSQLVGIWLLVRVGVAGMAWGMVVALAGGSVLLLRDGARSCRLSPSHLAQTVTRGLGLPTALCALVAVGLTYEMEPSTWPAVLVVALTAGVSYAVSFFLLGAREEEKAFIREVLSLPTAAAKVGVGALRKNLRQVRSLRSTWYLGWALLDQLRDPWASPQRFEWEFKREVDPWGFNTKPSERSRYESALWMLDQTPKGTRFQCALEVGCAEGAFTELLTQRCSSILAVDVSPSALNRARTRGKGWGNVQFDHWDIRRDPVPGRFDLVVVMGVLEFFARPRQLKAMRTKLVDLLEPTGYLLVTTTRANKVVESAWWSAYLLRGGKRINAFLAEAAGLREIKTRIGDFFVCSLYQRDE